MRLSTIGGKEIVNLCDGSRLGIIAESDLLIDEKTGKIHALLIPESKGFFSFFSNDSLTEIPWETIRKIGNDMIIIELENNHKKKY
ncbi:YlmC/YmxH family sporulation protein [Alkaliphilus sp. MSJ-5]|uniref:YlmC/YmxH family sporulation protein n=1 Tax=Alkaliphilus flagellatus TaxID=2841507 RepID=A0ABS6G4P9_9FIRM|nr:MULTISPECIES: YlmC/YmxH family sporulation protein [Alkaliphilus]MBU5677470.1 YlmC/YmxH family sporulation protein [Alkaliphilus flagellatus]QUH20784.1 YlmC/YmxH family sporulation protein [Alkaliphilus sp. B6464]